jgi:hypothetical protein
MCSNYNDSKMCCDFTKFEEEIVVVMFEDIRKIAQL